ncbi:MAG: PAS domain S-box protein [Desulfobacteraceae bacterium]|nr:PAS domain S-box protein [Desulfobacteraceae bacterium]
MTLKINPELLAKLIEQTVQIIYHAQTVTGKVSWHGASEAICGYPDSDLKNWRVQQWQDHIHPEDQSGVIGAHEKAFKDKGSYCLEYRFKRKTGDYIWLEDHGFYANDGSTAMIGSIKDINKRKTFELKLVKYQNELEDRVVRRTSELMNINSRLSHEIKRRYRMDAALEESEERYRRVFENTGAATILIEKDMTISMANAKASELFGHPVNELVGNFKVVDFATSEHRDRLMLFHELYVQQNPNAPTQFEFKIINNNNKILDIVAQIQWITQTGQAVASFLDVTETKTALRDRERLATVIEQSADSILITNMHGLIEYANKAFETIHGIDRAGIIGKTYEESFFSPQERKIIKKMTYMVSKKDNWSSRIHTKNPNGKIIIADTNIFPICNRQGKAVNLVCSKKDITREVQLEKQLQHSQKMEAIGTLAGGIAHDFNNILGGILGFAELSIRIIPEEKNRLHHNLRRILQGCERAKDLIRHILTFSRKNDEKNKPIEIQLVVKEALKLLRASIPSSIEFRQFIESKPSVVHTTATHIHQVVMNLCTNAAQAMQKTGGELMVMLKNMELTPEQCQSRYNVTPGPYAAITVKDTGHGMETQALERAFEPYFTTKAPKGGTGLGLAVVHGIVQNMNGLIQIESIIGKGTTVNVFLPRLTNMVENKESSLVEPPRGKEKILIVDDELFILEIMKELLVTLGYEVDTFESGQQALDQLRKNPDKYDLLIADQAMPKMTGYQLVDHVRRIQPDLPVILCTGLGIDEMDEAFKAAKILAVLHKPIQYEQLAFTVRKVLDSKNQSFELTSTPRTQA